MIDKIIESKEFRTSEAYQNLLRFLFEYHLKDEVPKESAIAIEFFDKKISEINDESNIRSHMYYLRKKLAQYYKTEGKEDNITVCIPKGHYEMQFRSTDKNKPAKVFKAEQAPRKDIKLHLVYTCILIFFMISFIICWQQSPKIQDPIPKSNPIWHSFFNTDYPINLVVGDLFVFEEWNDDSDEYRRIMDQNITSEDQFLKYQSENPDKKTRDLVLNELPHNIIFNMQDILHVFNSFNCTFEIKFATSFKYKDLKEHNILYLGSFSRLQLLSDFLQVLPIRYKRNRYIRSLSLFSERMDTLITFETNKVNYIEGTNVDYGLVLKVPGLNGETYLFMTGFGYMAQIELVKKLCNESALKTLEDQIKNQYNTGIPEYFSAIFEVIGYPNTGYSTELIFFEEIDADKYKTSIKHFLTDE